MNSKKVYIVILLTVLLLNSCKLKLYNGRYLTDDYHPWELIIHDDEFESTFYSMNYLTGYGKISLEDSILTLRFSNFDTLTNEIKKTIIDGNAIDSIELHIRTFNRTDQTFLQYTSISVTTLCGDLICSDYVKNDNEPLLLNVKITEEPLILTANYVGYKTLQDTISLKNNQSIDIYLSPKEKINTVDNGVTYIFKVIKSNKRVIKLLSENCGQTEIFKRKN